MTPDPAHAGSSGSWGIHGADAPDRNAILIHVGSTERRDGKIFVNAPSCESSTWSESMEPTRSRG